MMRKTTVPSFEFEEQLWIKGYTQIAGIDEAGRGPLAGPVVAASVMLPRDVCILGLNDSKKLSAKKREILFSEIVEFGCVGIGIVEMERIDEINILNATKEAMLISVKNMLIQPDYLLIDGTIALLTNIDQEYIISGDAKSFSIAAASIIAKVIRDDIMMELHKMLPVYGWDKNKGYGTKIHRDAIKLYGPSQYHRYSFKGVSEYA
jgi:ribonuclease HII